METFLQNHYKNLIKEKCLTKSTRKILCDRIVEDFLQKDCYMHLSEFDRIATEIVEIFPQEKKETFYIAGKRPGGMLYNRFRNCSSKLRKVGLYTITNRKRRLSVDSSDYNSNLSSSSGNFSLVFY